MKIVKIINIYFIFCLAFFMLNCTKKDDNKTIPIPSSKIESFIDSTMAAANSSSTTSEPIMKKILSYKDFKLGMKEDEIKNLLNQTDYTTSSDPFGQLNKNTQFLHIYHVKWWGLDGDLKLEFDEAEGKMVDADWVVGIITQSDYNILKREVDQDLQGVKKSKEYGFELWESGSTDYVFESGKVHFEIQKAGIIPFESKKDQISVEWDSVKNGGVLTVKWKLLVLLPGPYSHYATCDFYSPGRKRGDDRIHLYGNIDRFSLHSGDIILVTGTASGVDNVYYDNGYWRNSVILYANDVVNLGRE